MSKSNRYFFYNLVFQIRPCGLDNIESRMKFVINEQLWGTIYILTNL